MASSFKIGSILNQKTLSQAKDSHKVVYLDINNIKPNPANEEIYSTEGIDLLSYSIEDKGLLQPLVVRKLEQSDSSGDETYEVISGHRRRLAILEIIERDSSKSAVFSYVPCIVRPAESNSDESSPDNEEKETLIDGNLFNRHKTDAEIAKEIAIKKEILETRKKNGEKIAGKILTLIANEMGISTHQAKKFNAINRNASDEVKEAFEKGEISTQAAYELSKADEETQKEILEKNKDAKTTITSKDVTGVLNKNDSTGTNDESTVEDTTVGETTVEETAVGVSVDESDEFTDVDIETTETPSSTNKKTNEDAKPQILTPLPREDDKDKEDDNEPVNPRFEIITKLASLIKKFNQESNTITFDSNEISEARKALDLTYNFIIEQ